MAANPDERQNAKMVTEFGTDGWGLHIERLSEDPWAPKILYKIEREGICLPAILQDQVCGCIPVCKVPKKRSYLYITENAIEQNIACWSLFNPFKMKFFSVEDNIMKEYAARPPPL